MSRSKAEELLMAGETNSKQRDSHCELWRQGPGGAPTCDT